MPEEEKTLRSEIKDEKQVVEKKAVNLADIAMDKVSTEQLLRLKYDEETDYRKKASIAARIISLGLDT